MSANSRAALVLHTGQFDRTLEYFRPILIYTHLVFDPSNLQSHSYNDCFSCNNCTGLETKEEVIYLEMIIFTTFFSGRRDLCCCIFSEEQTKQIAYDSPYGFATKISDSILVPAQVRLKR
jgi:hypothetical protein